MTHRHKNNAATYRFVVLMISPFTCIYIGELDRAYEAANWHQPISDIR